MCIIKIKSFIPSTFFSQIVQQKLQVDSPWTLKLLLMIQILDLNVETEFGNDKCRKYTITQDKF